MDGVWTRGRSRIYYLEQNRAPAAVGAEGRSGEGKTSAETAADSFSRRVVNRQRLRNISLTARRLSRSRSSPRAFTRFDESAPSRCVNHETDDSPNLMLSRERERETESKGTRIGIRLKGESFLRARIRTLPKVEGTKGDGTLGATRPRLQSHCGVTRIPGASIRGRFPIFRKPRTGNDFRPSRVSPLRPHRL